MTKTEYNLTTRFDAHEIWADLRVLRTDIPGSEDPLPPMWFIHLLADLGREIREEVEHEIDRRTEEASDLAISVEYAFDEMKQTQEQQTKDIAILQTRIQDLQKNLNQ